MKEKRVWKLHRLFLGFIAVLVLAAAPVYAGGTWTVSQQLNTVTAYNSHMFYTIKGSEGGLIVIDGGYIQNSEYVKSVIMKAGGTVDLWIVTHPHRDHAGAFIKLAQDKSIKIKKVVTVKIPEKVFVSEHQYGYSLFKSFYNVLSGMKNVVYVNKDDVIRFKGLKIRFFSAYSKKQKFSSTDIYFLNVYSLVFRISGKNKSILFTGDIYKDQADELAREYGSKLKSDYLQAPHHGRLNKEPVYFYETVAPKKTFVDGSGTLNILELMKISKILYLGTVNKVKIS